MARFVVEVIDGLDLRAMSGSYRGSGSASYHPRMLLGIFRSERVVTLLPREWCVASTNAVQE